MTATTISAESEREMTDDPTCKAQGFNVYSVTGVDPETHAYAMAKYSRSALSMRDSLKEISHERAEKFLNTFYFQYGHRSIADLAHLSFSIERLSMLAAIALVDESKWDGQERSSRYQDFKRSGYYTPPLSHTLKAKYIALIESLFEEYGVVSHQMQQFYMDTVEKPFDLADDTYKRNLRARSFDVARYLLPLSTNTSVGQIVNARTLESQISRLAADPHSEVRELSNALKTAAKSQPYNFIVEQLKDILQSTSNSHSELDVSAFDRILNVSPVAATLVKYAEARDFDIQSRKELKTLASELLSQTTIKEANRVTLCKPEAVENEIAATVLYQHSHHSYEQLLGIVSDMPVSDREEIIKVAVRNRGRHDEISRPFSSGYEFQFDVLMDIGGFRDLHRHRRCVQILQEYSPIHGFSMPAEVETIGRSKQFSQLMGECQDFWSNLQTEDTESSFSANYVLPLAFRRRALFKMDFAEVLYVCELRTSPAGHFSYRGAAYEMYAEVVRQHPSLAELIRVHDIKESIDLSRR